MLVAELKNKDVVFLIKSDGQYGKCVIEYVVYKMSDQFVYVRPKDKQLDGTETHKFLKNHSIPCLATMKGAKRRSDYAASLHASKDEAERVIVMNANRSRLQKIISQAVNDRAGFGMGNQNNDYDFDPSLLDNLETALNAIFRRSTDDAR